MNVGNSLGLGVGKHLAASYPYSAGIGVGAVAYFILQGILRPTILKWALAPRFSFLFMPPGCGWLKSLDYEKVIADDLFLVVLCAVLCANGTFDVQRSADRWQQTGICERIAAPRICVCR